MQGMGWSCIEELVWGDAQHSWVRPGQLFTRGPGTYKVSSAAHACRLWKQSSRCIIWNAAALR